MTIEGDPSPFLGGEVDTAEHSRESRAKKVIIGPAVMPKAATEKTKDPIVLVAGINQLVRGRAYRLISNDWFKFWSLMPINWCRNM